MISCSPSKRNTSSFEYLLFFNSSSIRSISSLGSFLHSVRKSFISLEFGLRNVTIRSVLSLNFFETAWNCCVITIVENPLCLPENVKLMKLFVKPFTVDPCAQSSSMIRLFVSPNISSMYPMNESTWSCLQGIGKIFLSFMYFHSRYVLFHGYDGQIKNIYSKHPL